MKKSSPITYLENNELILGSWQRVVLLEFDGPRERKIKINFL
ncbi:MAG: YjbQ family protein [Candidatus Aenigmatarchaeota archaeon]